MHIIQYFAPKDLKYLLITRALSYIVIIQLTNSENLMLILLKQKRHQSKVNRVRKKLFKVVAIVERDQNSEFNSTEITK